MRQACVHSWQAHCPCCCPPCTVHGCLARLLSGSSNTGLAYRSAAAGACSLRRHAAAARCHQLRRLCTCRSGGRAWCWWKALLPKVHSVMTQHPSVQAAKPNKQWRIMMKGNSTSPVAPAYPAASALPPPPRFSAREAAAAASAARAPACSCWSVSRDARTLLAARAGRHRATQTGRPPSRLKLLLDMPCMPGRDGSAPRKPQLPGSIPACGNAAG